MDPKFALVVDQLQPCFERLMALTPFRNGALPQQMPNKGVYLFSEGNRHLYIGRSNNLRRRYGHHSNPGSPHNQAVFAFKLAREATGSMKASYKAGAESRAGLSADAIFGLAFSDAKRRVRAMNFRFTEQEDQTLQALLELYGAIVLQCPYNDFDTH